MARAGLADAVRVARWADASLRPGSGAGERDGKGTLSTATAERAAADLALTADQVRADWDTARLMRPRRGARRQRAPRLAPARLGP